MEQQADTQSVSGGRTGSSRLTHRVCQGSAQGVHKDNRTNNYGEGQDRGEQSTEC